MHGRRLPARGRVLRVVMERKTSSRRPRWRTRGQLLRRVVGEDAAVRDDDGAVADGVDLFEDVCGDDDDLVLRHRVDERADFVLLIRIQAVGGFVENQHRWIVQQRLRQSDAALESFGERFDHLLQHASEMRVAAMTSGHPALATVAGQSAHVGDEVEEAAHRHFSVGGAPSGRYPMQDLQRAALTSTSCPQTRTVPEVGARNPVIIFIVVDLPAPFGPEKARGPAPVRH